MKKENLQWHPALAAHFALRSKKKEKNFGHIFRGYNIEGVYYLTGAPIPIQFLYIPKLSGGEKKEKMLAKRRN